MAKMMRKITVLCMVLVFCIGIMTLPVLAANNGNGKGNGNGNGNTGTGQTQVHIHMQDGNVGSNGDDVTLIVGDKEYEGNIQGSKLNIEMDSTDNGFDFGADESMEVSYKNNKTGETGTITLTHKEGNGNNIGNEKDEGLNNFNGTVKQPTQPTPTEPPVTEPPVTEPPVTEPPVTEPPVTEPPVTEPPVTEPPVTEPPVTEPPVTEPPVTEPPVTEPPVTEPPVTETPAPQPQEEYPVMTLNDDGLVTIDDGDVPLADVPRTGDISLLWMATSSLAAGGIILLNRKRK